MNLNLRYFLIVRKIREFFGLSKCCTERFEHRNITKNTMNSIFKGLIAGYGAKKLGGGCLGTIVVFIIIWIVLGQCS
jgi:hypothetical protein